MQVKRGQLGVGNDLFVGARNVYRILESIQNAFDKYDELYNFVIK